MTTPNLPGDVLDDALRPAWQRQQDAAWQAVIAENEKRTAPALNELRRTMPKPSVFNRRRNEIATLVDALIALDLAWTPDDVYPNVHKTPGWDHDWVVQAIERTLYMALPDQLHERRTFRLTAEQYQRFEEQGQRWVARRNEHLARVPTHEEVQELQRRLHEEAQLRSEMGHRPRSSHGRRRGGPDDLDSWTNNPSSPVPNVYNGFGSGMGG